MHCQQRIASVYGINIRLTLNFLHQFVSFHNFPKLSRFECHRERLVGYCQQCLSEFSKCPYILRESFNKERPLPNPKNDDDAVAPSTSSTLTGNSPFDYI